MSSYHRLLLYLKPYKKHMLIGFPCLAVVAIINILVPLIFKYLIDDVLIAANVGLLNILAIAAVLIYFLKGILNYTQVYLLSGMGQKVVVDIRKQIYSHIQGLSLNFYANNTTGDLMSRITNDVNIIQESITVGISNLILQPIVVVGSIVALFILNWRLALISFLIIPLVAFAINKSGQRMRQVSGRIQKELSKVTGILQETISGIRIVKAFNMEKKEKEKFNKANHKTLAANMKGVQIKATITPVVEILMAIGIAFIIWFGGHEVIRGKMTIGDLPAFLGYLAMLGSPLNILSDSYNIFQKAVGAAERIFEILDVEDKVKERENAINMPIIKGNVCFENVSFAYDDEEVLKDINLDINSGQTLALVGHSGAGKSTLVNLIPRFYDLDEGNIYIDGINIKDVKITSLRRQIGIVPQETILFNGTIAENIAYGSDCQDMNLIRQAARQANAHEFIKNMVKDYDTQVGERGESLSGGQRQRIAIARAILIDPRILILDEATSSLDTRSEALVQEALERLMENRTSFVIAHRLSTIKNADKILVVENGEVVEEGNHNYLISKKGYYYNLYKKSFQL